jgi:hypothetical protein
MSDLVNVVSGKRYTYQESHNLRGYPATHAAFGDRLTTLCGVVAVGWMFNWGKPFDAGAVNCRHCLRKMRMMGY